MPWLERIAIALLAFGFCGLGLMAWQPSSQATPSGIQPTYALAISSGSELQLGENSSHPSPERPLLTCEKVFRLASVSIGASCISHGWEVSITE